MKKELLTETNLNNSKKLSKITSALLDVLIDKPFLLELIVNITINKVYKSIGKELKMLSKEYPEIYKAIKMTLIKDADSKF